MSALLGLSIEEYFKYHPPKTDERKSAHDRANSVTLELCKRLREMDAIDGNADRQEEAIDSQKLTELCENAECRLWIERTILSLKDFLRNRQIGDEQGLLDSQAASEILMRIQQIRMFANQGITLDELKKLRGFVG